MRDPARPTILTTVTSIQLSLQGVQQRLLIPHLQRQQEVGVGMPEEEPEAVGASLVDAEVAEVARIQRGSRLSLLKRLIC
jgi:hypothetical protein